jgi:hypothetical protein
MAAGISRLGVLIGSSEKKGEFMRLHPSVEWKTETLVESDESIAQKESN